MRCVWFAALLLGSSLGARAELPDAAIDWGGKLQLQSDISAMADNGPLARANALQPGSATLAGNGATLAAELRAAAQGWNALVTLQQQAVQNRQDSSSSWVNELAYTGSAGDWQLSAGKKIVSWDVGYAFRPNDLVQQEVRRTLVSHTATGRALLQAEHFDSDSAWSLVAVNPGDSPDARAADEPALAARYYRHQGAADWYGFVRQGLRTGSSLGAAVAWVATDALELHASVRALQQSDTLDLVAPAGVLATQTPWRNSSVRDTTQLLLGAQWTSAQQLSLLLEAWWDGTAVAPAQWEAWRQRNHSLERLAGQGAPLAAVAGNLAWQADAFAASGSLQRSNLFVRLAWEHEGWQPALDLLHHPQDGGRMLTLSLRHQGDRVQLQGGWRVTGGPDSAVLAQLPYRQQAYLLGTWAF